MTKQKNVWVSPDGKGSWNVKVAGNQRASNNFSNKADAMNRGRQLAERNHSELIGQKRNGQINFKNSYGHDPRNVKG